MLPLTHLSPLTEAAAQFAAAGGPLDPLLIEGPANTPIPPTLIEPAPAPGCVGPSRPVEDSHLRHLIIGSPDGVQDAVARLHLLHYVERRYWTPLIAIRDRGIHLTPTHGQVLSYLVQQRPIR